MEFVILIVLILLNGIFAMSELAIVSARKSRLQEFAAKGHPSANIALELARDPNRFLSTVQIGISLVGIIAGAFGGSTLAEGVATFIKTNVPTLADYADQLGFILIVGLITYLSLVIGELVPKRIALNNPERIALIMARPMQILAFIASPLVTLLSVSTELLARVVGVRGNRENAVTESEILSMIREGIKLGRFATQEQQMVREIFDMDDTYASAIMTPRTDIAWLDINEDEVEHRELISQNKHSAFPVCDGALDNVLGVVSSRDLLATVIDDGEFDLHAIMQEPVFVPKTVNVASVLNQLNNAPTNIALILDEYGGIEGLLTLSDIVQEVFHLRTENEAQIIENDDGSWTIDGHLGMDDLERQLADLNLPEGEQHDYQTLAGFVLTRLGQIPQDGDSFDWGLYRFEVLAMRQKRVDKVNVMLINPLQE